MEDMFKNYPYAILCDDVLWVFLGEGCGRIKYGVGNGLGNCSIHDDLSLTVFVVEDFSRRRYHKLNKFFLWINMAEVRENIILLLDLGCGVQGNFIIKMLINQGVILEVNVA